MVLKVVKINVFDSIEKEINSYATVISDYNLNIYCTYKVRICNIIKIISDNIFTKCIIRVGYNFPFWYTSCYLTITIQIISTVILYYFSILSKIYLV